MKTIGNFVVITGLDGSGTSSLAAALCERDPHGVLVRTPSGPFEEGRNLFDTDKVRTVSHSAHYLFYLASVVYASVTINKLLATHHNVYCVRYLIDTVVSHRANGVNAELEYETKEYSIRKPDVTLFLDIDEHIRQDRITFRGKSDLDKVLDKDSMRGRFIAEFNRYSHIFHKLNNSQSLEETTKNALRLLPWLNLK